LIVGLILSHTFLKLFARLERNHFTGGNLNRFAGLPVCGLRPVRAARSLRLKVPNPTRTTS
jgi:hypothetical protein